MQLAEDVLCGLFMRITQKVFELSSELKLNVKNINHLRLLKNSFDFSFRHVKRLSFGFFCAVPRLSLNYPLKR